MPLNVNEKIRKLSPARRKRVEGKSFDQNESSKHASAGTMVSQFRKERLPLRMSVNWNNTITIPAM